MLDLKDNYPNIYHLVIKYQNGFNNLLTISEKMNSIPKLADRNLNPALKFPYLNAYMNDMSPIIILLLIVYSG